MRRAVSSVRAEVTRKNRGQVARAETGAAYGERARDLAGRDEAAGSKAAQTVATTPPTPIRTKAGPQPRPGALRSSTAPKAAGAAAPMPIPRIERTASTRPR